MAHKVSNFGPKTWILRRETEKSGPREWRIKCLIFDIKQILIRETLNLGPRGWRLKCLIYDKKMDFKA